MQFACLFSHLVSLPSLQFPRSIICTFVSLFREPNVFLKIDYSTILMSSKRENEKKKLNDFYIFALICLNSSQTNCSRKEY